MSKYHASKNGKPMCGSGRIDGFKTVVVTAKEWNKLSADRRCEKCIAAIKNMKSA